MWIQSHNTLRTHPKLFRLMRLMGWDTSQAIGTLLMFWWWCLDYAPEGDLRRYDSAEIGAAVGLSGEKAEQFTKAMIQARFLDETPYFRVHDGGTMQGPYSGQNTSVTPHIWKYIRDQYESKYSTGTDGELDGNSTTEDSQGDLYSTAIHNIHT